MARRRTALAALATLVLTSIGAPAWAQPAEGAAAPTDGAAPPTDGAAPPVKDPAVVKKWLTAGKAAIKKSAWAVAVTAFENALAAGADPNVYLDLALAEEKLGNLDRAAIHLRVVTGATLGIRADVKKKASARYDALSMKVGLLTLAVTPEGATVSLGAERIATAPMAEPVILMPGMYTLSFSADGFEPKDVEIKVEEGSESERTVELAPIEVIVRPPPRPAEPTPAPVRPASHAPRPRLALYIGGGVTIGALGIGVVTGLLATSRHGTFTDPASSSGERDDARSSGQNLALITDITLGVGIAAAAFTTYWYLARYKPAQRTAGAVGGERSDQARAKVELVPWVQAEAGGFTVAGSF